jgi:hypothetical protein
MYIVDLIVKFFLYAISLLARIITPLVMRYDLRNRGRDGGSPDIFPFTCET